MLTGLYSEQTASSRPGVGASGIGRWVLLCLCICLAAGCSVKKMAVNKLGDALAKSGSTFGSDDDPELVKAAVPFALKLMESLLAESPKHEGLLFAASSSFTQYAYAFVQLEADELEERDVAVAQAMRQRARRLYLRARNYGLRGLEANHAGFTNTLSADPERALRKTRKADVALLYWTAASWAAAISVLKDDPDLIADVALVEALMDKALALDADFDHGAIHTFLISYEPSRQGAEAGAETRARAHFARAMELSDGQQAGPLVALAETVALQNQNLNEFQALLNQALAIDPNAKPEWRLVNLVMQQRAKWLLTRTEDLFLLPETQ
jgi:predicted anti-sigma-YlaC factor YlaD